MKKLVSSIAIQRMPAITNHTWIPNRSLTGPANASPIGEEIERRLPRSANCAARLPTSDSCCPVQMVKKGAF